LTERRYFQSSAARISSFFTRSGSRRRSRRLLAGVIDAEELVDEEMHVFGDDFALSKLLKRRFSAESPADEGVEGIDLHAVDFRLRAAKPMSAIWCWPHELGSR